MSISQIWHFLLDLCRQYSGQHARPHEAAGSCAPILIAINSRVALSITACCASTIEFSSSRFRPGSSGGPRSSDNSEARYTNVLEPGRPLDAVATEARPYPDDTTQDERDTVGTKTAGRGDVDNSHESRRPWTTPGGDYASRESTLRPTETSYTNVLGYFLKDSGHNLVTNACKGILWPGGKRTRPAYGCSDSLSWPVVYG